MLLMSKFLSYLFHAEYQSQDVGPSFQGRESGQHVEAHSKVSGVVSQNVKNAQIGGENTRFINNCKCWFSIMISESLTVWLLITPYPYIQ